MKTLATKIAETKAKFEAKVEGVNYITSMNASTTTHCFVKMTLSENWSVGQVTVAGENAMHVSLNPKAAAKVLMNIFKIDPSVVKLNKGVMYKPLKKVQAETLGLNTGKESVLVKEISSELADKMLKMIPTCDLYNVENIVNIFDDIDALYRMYQELTIDAAKKVMIVEIKFAITKYKAKSLKKFMASYDYDKKEFKYDKVFPSSIEFFDDHFHKMQETAMKFVGQMMELSRDAVQGMPAAEVERLRAYRGVGPANSIKEVVKYAYTKICASLNIELERLYNDSLDMEYDEDNDLVKAVKKANNEKVAMIANLARQLLRGYSDEDKASMIQLAAKSKDGKIDKMSSNMMATSLLTEEFLTMVKENSSEIDVMGYKISKNNGLNVGDKVEFINGVSENGSLIDFKDELVYANGEFEIKEFRGSLYAVKPLVFKAPEADMTKRLFFVKNGKFLDTNYAKICAALKENATVIVDEMGDIIINDKVVASVKTPSTTEEEFDALLSVKGWISHVTIVDKNKDAGINAPVVMFELSDIVELEEEAEEEIDETDLFDEDDSVVESDDIEDEEVPDVDDLLDELLDEEEEFEI